MNPEIIAVVDRIQTVLEERETAEQEILMPLVSENTEPSIAFNGHSPHEIEKLVIEVAREVLAEKRLENEVQLLGARVYGERTRDGM